MGNIEIAVWKYTLESIVHGTWKEYGNDNVSLVMPK